MKLKLISGFLIIFLFSLHTFQVNAQRGKNGDYVVAGTNQILNTYTSLTVNANVGNTSITVANNAMTGGAFGGALEPGDLILIIQMQGATINCETYTSNANPSGGFFGDYTVPLPYTFAYTWYDHIHEWGALNWFGYFNEPYNGYNNAGKYEQVEVLSVSGTNTINLQCGLRNNYTASGHVQIVRIPRFNNLTVPAGTSVIPTLWNGTTGGIIGLEVDATLDVNGLISSDAAGFRGGQVDAFGSPGNTTNLNEVRFAGSHNPAEGSEKGEGIHGYRNELDAIYSRYGISGASNGGGGGGYQNAGGGGGSNIYNGALRYTGTGVPDPAYNVNWALDFCYPNNNSDPQSYSNLVNRVSPGGGVGGYALSQSNQNENTLGPRNAAWGGDARKSNGGRGGHPLAYDPTRMFFGGGGGAGDQDSGQGGSGGRGGGIVFVTVYGTTTGSGTISANGANGQQTNPNNNSATFSNPRRGNDGAGGGGAGGYIYIQNADPLPGTLLLEARGGNGGNQVLSYWGPQTDEAGGPGGGGAGGGIAHNGGAATEDVTAGAGGTTNSSHVSNFPLNGATGGFQGVASLPTTIYDLAISDTVICGAGSVDLTVTVTGTLPAGSSIEWYNAQFGGSILNTGATYTVAPASTTTYWIGVCDGGTFRIPVTVSVLPSTPATFNAATPVCENGTVTLPATSIEGFTGTWSPAPNNTATTTYTFTPDPGQCGDLGSLEVVIIPEATGTDVQVQCGSYTWIDGNTYSASTTAPTFTIPGGAANGCDSTVSLNLTINTPSTGTDVQVQCGSYTWIDGNTYNASTTTPTFTIPGGAANGCDSTVTLNLTINTPSTGTDVQVQCGSYTWIDGNTYNASTTTPTFTIPGGAANGCDSTVTLNLTINTPATGTDVQVQCGSYTWIDGNTYNTSTTTPTFTIPGGAANGCDSIVTLDLTINSFVTGTDVQVQCGSYTWIDGNTYSASTTTPTYTISGGAANGCDSLVTLNLTINSFVPGTDTQVQCGSYTWIDGNTYNASTTTPTYTITGGAANGCDSVVTLNLTINNPTTGTDVQVQCGSYTWIDGNTYNASTTTPTYTITGGAANGCDSVVTLNLTINNPTTGTDIQVQCGSYTWIDGNTYNASTTTPTFTIPGGAANGCDSTVTLNLTINNSTTGTDVQVQCVSYTWIDGNTYNASTSTPTYTIPGGAANGCDSIVTLNLTINNPTTGTDVQVQCGSYTWIDGNTYNASTTTPTFTIPGGAANGCDSIVTLNLTINTPTTGTDVQVQCGSYTWIDGNTYSASTTTPTFTIPGGAANGCDSIVTLNLTINNPAAGTDVQVQCGSYTWIDGNTYSASTTTPTITIPGGAANGCDSTVTLNLTINAPATGTDVQVQCGSYTWIDGNTYNASTTTPTFTILGGAANGCDSTVTLNLTINTPATGTDVQVQCGSYTWIDGNTYNASTTTPTFTIPGGAANGCDSTVTLNLTINNPTTGTDVQNWCGSFTWIDGNTYNSSTNTPTYTIVGGAANGCDSIVTLNLTINSFVTGTDVQTHCNTYTWIDGNTYTTSTNTPTYTISGGSVNGCDSIVTLNLTINNPLTGTDIQEHCDSYTWIDGNTYNASTTIPTFTIPGGATNGCDSIVTLNLTINTTPTVPSVSPDTTYCSGDSLVQMNAIGSGGTLNWYDGAGLVNVIGSGTDLTPNDVLGQTAYYVTETSPEGCTSAAAIIVITVSECADVVVPTAFTPDNDGVNDYWIVQDLDTRFPNNRVIIFNRWGNIVFEHQSDPSNPYSLNPWDGKNQANGQPLPVASYYYIIETGEEGVDDLKGTVTILLD